MAGRRRKRNPFRGIRTLIVSRRGGGSATSQGGVGVSGDYSFYAAAVPGGKGILQIAIVNGRQQTPVIVPMFSIETFDDYAPGPAPLLVAGFGWNAGGLVKVPFVVIVGEETFESYDEGPVNETALVDGAGWDGGAALPQPYAQHVGIEDFESYAEGVASGPVLTGGTGWNGDAGLFSY
ncbi:hypothetical protein GC207_13585 [bacterium]|nr:hypothetical protein [bacterium]